MGPITVIMIMSCLRVIVRKVPVGLVRCEVVH